MSRRVESLKYFSDLGEAGIDATVLEHDFTPAIQGLTAEALIGFTEEEIGILVTALVRVKLAPARFKSLVLIIIPQTTVSQQAVHDVLIWVCTYFATGALSAVIVALQWITGLVDNGLTNEDYVDDFFEFFFTILGRPKLEAHVSKLIYMLTKPDDISRWRVTILLKIHEKNGRQKHTNAILCQFKLLRPECVPENIPTMNAHFAFKNIPEPLSVQFNNARLRKQAASGATGTSRDVLVWDKPLAAIKKTGARKYAKIDFIPEVDYIAFVSSLYRKKDLCSILQFKSIEALGCYQLSVDIPCQSMSLLANIGGCHVLAFGGARLQERFSYALYHHLFPVFIRRSSTVPEKSKEDVLNKLVAFEGYMQQGIPVVSRFLAEYVHDWNGHDFAPQIFKLLERITFSSFEELHAIILEHIHRFFVQSDIDSKCLIISTMRRLLRNLFLEVYRMQEKLPSLFVGTTAMWDPVDTLTKMTQFVGDLCSLGLIIEPDSALILDESLTFYEMVSRLEDQSRLPLWTIMSPAIVYRGLFTSNSHFVSRVITLLLRYKNDDNERLKSMGVRVDFKPKFSMVKMYVADYYNCLWNGKAFSKRNEGFILRDISKKSISRVLGQNVTDNDNAFSLFNHYAFSPFLLFSESENDPSAKRRKKDDDQFSDQLAIVKTYMPETIALLLACEDFFGSDESQ